MRKLVFFVGGAGAGKTTVAKTLAERNGITLLDMDTLLRPAAVALMNAAGGDPSDRDSSQYKSLCRDLGYRITMDAALENISLGTSVFVVGPFTKETEDPKWIDQELARIGASMQNVDVKVVVVNLANEQHYRSRIEQRGSVLDQWKLDNWSEFSPSLTARVMKWSLPGDSVLFYDNSQPLGPEKIASLERFVFGMSD
ncbi:MAG: AAA family ATPase [Candidatus Pristimantibacillus sp.]